MHIELHGFNAVIHGIGEDDVVQMCNNILKIPFELFRPSEFNNTKVFKHSFGKAKVSAYIRINTSNDRGYVTLELKGSFFDNSPDFSFENLLLYLSSSQLKYTPKQLDIAFNDDKCCLNLKHIRHWCADCDVYCTGSLVTRYAPEEVRSRRRFRRIQLGSARSKSNFATIYRRRVTPISRTTRLMRIEVKLKDKDKIAYILENYSDTLLENFEARSLELLVSCINFITMDSKKKRSPSKQPSWRSFLGSDIQRINLRELKEERRKNRAAADKTTFNKSAMRHGTMLKNYVARCSVLSSEEEALRRLEDISGLSISKKTQLQQI